MHYEVTMPGRMAWQIYLDGESMITPDNLIKGMVIKKNTAGDFVKTGRKVIIRDWLMVEIIGDTQAGF